MGKRLGEYTKNNTKCMVEVNGVRLIDRMLTQLAARDLSRVVIVVGYKKDELIGHIGNRYDDLIKIEYVHNDIYDKTNNIYSLALAKQYMLEEDTLLLESDLIFDDSMLDLIINSRIFDFGYVYDGWGGPSFLIENLVRGKKTDFESEYAKKEKGITKQYDQVIAWFENYGD